MSRSIYEALFEDPAADAPWPEPVPSPEHVPSPEPAPSPLLRAFARAAARRRAARELAEEEFLLGAWAEVESAEELDLPTRLAAQDEGTARHRDYQAGSFVLRLWIDAAGEAWARQDQGPAGATLELSGRWIPLAPGQPASLGRDLLLPEQLRLHDATGRTWTLRPGTPGPGGA